MNEQMIKMIAGMAGVTPEQMNAIVLGVEGIVKELMPTMRRIEANQQIILKHIGAITDDGSDLDRGTGSGSDRAIEHVNGS